MGRVRVSEARSAHRRNITWGGPEALRSAGAHALSRSSTRSSGSGREGSAALLEFCDCSSRLAARLPDAVRTGFSPGRLLGACATRTERMENGQRSPILSEASSIFVMNCEALRGRQRACVCVGGGCRCHRLTKELGGGVGSSARPEWERRRGRQDIRPGAHSRRSGPYARSRLSLKWERTMREVRREAVRRRSKYRTRRIVVTCNDILPEGLHKHVHPAVAPRR